MDCTSTGCGGHGGRRRAVAKGLCQPCYDKLRNPGRAAIRAADRKAQYASDAEFRERQAQRARLRNTGFTPALTAQLRELQQGLCGICDREMDVEDKRAGAGENADHDHLSGEPRGLLCKTCNQSLGFFEKHADRAKKYLDNPPASRLR